MNWRNVFSAAWKRLWGYAPQVAGRNYPPICATSTCRTAQRMRVAQSPAAMPNLELRAQRLNNRDPKAAARYLEKHQALAKGACFNGGAS